MVRYLSLLVICCAIAACATPPQISNLSNISTPRAVTLSETISWTTKSTSWATVDLEEGLLSGTYVADAENNLGTFFSGNERPVFQCTERGKCRLLKGGVWMSKSTGELHLYMLLEASLPPVADSAESLKSGESGSTKLEGYFSKTEAGLIDKSIATATRPSTIYSNAVGTAMGLAIVNALIESDKGRRMIFPRLINDQRIIDLFHTSASSSIPK